MKKLIVVSGILSFVLVMGLACSSRPFTKTPALSGIGRYQLVSARAKYQGADDHDYEGPQVFLVDTQTGNVWRYSWEEVPKTLGEGEVINPEHFEFVPLSNLNSHEYYDDLVKQDEQRVKSGKIFQPLYPGNQGKANDK
jgi:hypothetical protein